MKTLHHLNAARVRYVHQWMQPKDASILDLGCGGGLFTEAMAKQGAKVVGVDQLPQLIETARNHALLSQLEIEYRCEDVCNMSVDQPSYFDLVTSFECLEHVADPKYLLSQCAAYCRPGGLVIVSTLNRTWQSWLLAIVAAEHVLQLLPKGTHHYSQFIRPSELQQWAKTDGLVLQDLMGVDYNPLWEKASLKRGQVNVNYLMCFQKKDD